MQAGESKEDTGANGQPSCPSTVQGLPWWGGVGKQPLQATSSGTAESLFTQHLSSVRAAVRPVGFVHPHFIPQSLPHVLGQISVDIQGQPVVATGLHSLRQPGYDEGRANENQQEPATPTVLPPTAGEYLFPHGQMELVHSVACTAYPCVDSYIGGVIATYGSQSMIHSHILGAQQTRMPLPSEVVEEEPVYVNAKQYHGILRRRKSRAKAESENKHVKSRKFDTSTLYGPFLIALPS
eukprot:c25979_g1_i5 orf=672-1385(+)